MDRISRQVRSKVMSAVHGQGTQLEDQLAQLLKKNKLLHFKRNPPGVYGNPDFVFQKQCVAIFVDSCFWHGCHWHCRMPASNRTYWQNKLERNRVRDRQVNRVLKREGWLVIRIWEHQLDDDEKFSKIVTRIKKALTF